MYLQYTLHKVKRFLTLLLCNMFGNRINSYVRFWYPFNSLQIHLEADPSDYLGDEGTRSNEARLEIIHKILGDILGLHVRAPVEITQVDFTRGYFLGHHVVRKFNVTNCILTNTGKCILTYIGKCILTNNW